MAEPTAVGPSALVDMKQGLDDITAKLRSLVNEIKAGNRPTKNGISYLEVKHLLLFSYCETLVFYILRKSEGRSVKDHPLWKRLAEIKFILEKVRVWFLHKSSPHLFRVFFFFFFFFFPISRKNISFGLQVWDRALELKQFINCCSCLSGICVQQMLGRQ
jgi:hypothetical protein